MNASAPRTDFAARLTSRRGAWVALGIALIVIVALFGVLRTSAEPGQATQAPLDSESARVTELLEKFPDADTQSVLLVASREDGAALNERDLGALGKLGTDLAPHFAGETAGPMPSDDGQAAMLVAPITAGNSGTENNETITEIRDAITAADVSGLTIHVTGGPAFGADVAGAFAGADFTLLLVTIGIVAVLLIATYRSPILWLIPLLVVAVADGLAGRVTGVAGAAWNLQFDAGIISVLVFGAGTNYALLLISRYREELRRHDDHRDALAAAWRGTMPAIVASNVTVVLALLTLVLAVIPGTHGLGVAAALGLLVALAAVLLVLPPFLAVCGRGVFWPFVPRPDQEHRDGRAWHRVATTVLAHPVRSIFAAVALMVVMATGLIGTQVGLDQAEKFRVQSESAIGLETLSEHFPAGEAQPITVIANEQAGEQVVAEVREVEGVVRAHPTGASTDGTLVSIMVTSEYSPSTPESLEQIAALRDVVHQVDGADALVGGAVANDLDARAGNEADLFLIAPLVLAVSFLVLLVLLRSLVAPTLLLLVNLASALAAIGAGAWLSRALFDQPALDLQVPLLAFLFLVALGIDYTIFLVDRARREAKLHGTREGMVAAVAHTGGVITSAGIVLAAVFAALGVLPLVTLGQLGLIVGVGVVFDTLIVRTVIVPAIFALVGDRIWWPSRPANVNTVAATTGSATIGTVRSSSPGRVPARASREGESDGAGEQAERQRVQEQERSE